MQNFLSLWLNAGAQITNCGQVQRLSQKKFGYSSFSQRSIGVQLTIQFSRVRGFKTRVIDSNHEEETLRQIAEIKGTHNSLLVKAGKNSNSQILEANLIEKFTLSI